jgi:hypothetical protein
MAKFHQGPAIVLKGGHGPDFFVVEKHRYGFQLNVVGDFQLNQYRHHQGIDLDGLPLRGRFDGDDRSVLVRPRVDLGNRVDPFVTARGQHQDRSKGQ